MYRRPRACCAVYSCCTGSCVCAEVIVCCAIGNPSPALTYTLAAVAAVGAYEALLWARYDAVEPPEVIGDTLNLAMPARPVHHQDVSRLMGDRHAVTPGELITNIPYYPAIAREMRNDRPGGTLTRSTAAHMYSHFMHKHKDSPLFRVSGAEAPLLVNDFIVNSARVAAQEAAIALRLMEDASQPPLTAPPWTIR